MAANNDDLNDAACEWLDELHRLAAKAKVAREAAEGWEDCAKPTTLDDLTRWSSEVPATGGMYWALFRGSNRVTVIELEYADSLPMAFSFGGPSSRYHDIALWGTELVPPDAP